MVLTLEELAEVVKKVALERKDKSYRHLDFYTTNLDIILENEEIDLDEWGQLSEEERGLAFERVQPLIREYMEAYLTSSIGYRES